NAGRSPGVAHAEGGVEPTEQTFLQNRVKDLIEAYRIHGHLGATIDPLGRQKSVRAPMLDPANFGLGEEHLDRLFHSSGLITQPAPLRTILQKLRNTYCRNIGVEYWSLPASEEREWLRQRMESCENQVTPEPAEQHHMLRKLVNVDVVDHFLHSKFLGAKRFSVAGAESIITTLDCLISTAADAGVGEVIFGMAHRGRLNVLMNVMGKAPAEVFSEFQKGSFDPNELLGAGDVKYHLGYHREHKTPRGKDIYLALAFNPSHLEAITPVIQGRVRAKQDAKPSLGFDASLGVSIHGDAAFSGQGVVAETLNLSQLDGYRTGGMIRIVLNNQVGFTTNPSDGRSGMYCTDVGKGIQVPVFHVNGDDPEAAAYVARLAVDFRQRFRRDVIIDLVCYRRFGHNEGDDPTFTQPEMYTLIHKHPSVRDRYQALLVDRGTTTLDACKEMENEFNTEFNDALERVRRDGPPAAALAPMHGMWEDYVGGDEPAQTPDTSIDTSLPAKLAAKLEARPDGLSVNRKVERVLQEHLKMYRGETPVNWAAAEHLAYGSLLMEGHPVRLSGQDCRRGTFSHRHVVLVDSTKGDQYVPLSHLDENQASFHCYNSPLSEFAVLGFEFGYSLASPFALVIWEAQFGDFANGAQVIIDQFLSSSEDKWNRISGLALMLPHGYEGQGPEHSSARLERFLQLCAEHNMVICNLTTPAQEFHALRRQVVGKWRKPLVLMTPKSLLRARFSFSPLEDFTEKKFQRVIGDDTTAREGIRRVIFSSGKVFYDLHDERTKLGLNDTALIRIEQLYPFPKAELTEILAQYDGVTDFVWVQEEPSNMGPWTYIAPRLNALIEGGALRYAGRERSASPATGSPDSHQLERTMLLAEAFQTSTH
ncbi:MAG: 2-oxoglutarate dehydrogenase E1 component, partial [Nannocystaceae bacterium]